MSSQQSPQEEDAARFALGCIQSAIRDATQAADLLKAATIMGDWNFALAYNLDGASQAVMSAQQLLKYALSRAENAAEDLADAKAAKDKP